jgi:hypothetical protein
MPVDPVKEKLRRLRKAFVITLFLLLLTAVIAWLVIKVWSTQLGWNIPFVILLAFLGWGILVEVIYWWYRRDRKKS